MSDIATKLEYLNGTKQALKESINNLGGDITSETTFREYAQELDQIYDNLPKTTGEDTNLSLTTLKGKMNITPKGDTQQTQYKGYNLLNITNSALISGYTAKGVTFTYNAENGYVNLNGTSTANIYSCFASLGASGTQYNNVFVAGTTYYIKANANTDTYGIYLLYQVQGGEIQGGPRVFGSQQGTWTCPENLIWVDVRAVVNESGTTLNNAKIYPTISKTSNVSYEPYVGGTASPNPTYPQNIEVVTKEQDVKVENVNILPLTIASKTSTTGITVTKNSDNSYHVSGTASALNLFNSSNTMTLKANTQYTLGLSNGNGNVQISLRNSSGTQIAKTETTKFVTFTPSEDVEVYLYIRVPSGATVDETIYPMLVYGNVTLSEYTPHQEQTQIVSLGDIELCKIGNYQDYLYKSNDKWYKKEYIGKYTFTGSENWFKHSTTSNNLFYISPVYNPIVSNMKKPSTNNVALECYSEMAQYKAVNTMAGNSVIGINPSVAGDVYVGTSLSGISDRDVFKTYLQSHTTHFYYLLENSSDIEITNETLIEQLDNLEKLKSYNGTTNISSSGNLSAILGVSALKGE